MNEAAMCAAISNASARYDEQRTGGTRAGEISHETEQSEFR